MTLFVYDNKKICYKSTNSFRATSLLGRLESCFAQRLAWDTRLGRVCRVTTPEICNSDKGLNVLISDKDLGIYVAENSYIKQIAQRAGLYSGLNVFTCRTVIENQLEIGIGQTDDVDKVYFYIRQLLLELPLWI